MSKRRKAGDWVWLSANAGFVGESNRLKAEIQPEPEQDLDYCMLCDDEGCREWSTLFTEPDPLHDGKRHTLYHVSECQMFDEKQGA
jgi:hypothetical protein